MTSTFLNSTKHIGYIRFLSRGREGGAVRGRVRVRPFPESGIINFGFMLLEEDWRGLEVDDMSSSDMVDMFVSLNDNMVDSVFPEKEIQVGPGDLPYFTEELRQIKRQRLRAYDRHGGKRIQYLRLKQRFDQILQREARKYIKKTETEVFEGRRGSGYKAIRKSGNQQSGQTCNKSQVSIQAYIEEGLSPQQAANRLAIYFSAISQTVDPLDEGKFPPALRQALQEGRATYAKPELTQHQVYCKILGVTKPKSSVRGDVPRVLLN